MRHHRSAFTVLFALICCSLLSIAVVDTPQIVEAQAPTTPVPNVPTALPTETPQGVTAALIASPSSGAAPLTVTFNDASLGAGLSGWAWDFGDGAGASGQGPHSHTYAAPGTFTASLTVSGTGGSGTTSQQIVVFEPVSVVEASFSYTQNGALDVCFTQTSIGTIVSSSWSFGDGGSSSDANPCHTYPNAGEYSVTLTVTGDGGESATATRVLSVLQQTPPPQAAFTPNRTTLPLGSTVRFTDQSSGAISTWAWDFGDGAASAERQPSHRYGATGVYTVTLTVSGPGGTGQASQTITVIEDETLTCSFSAMARVYVGQSLSLRNTSTVSPEAFSDFVWLANDVEFATTRDASISFDQVGAYTVRLEGTTETGRTCQAERTISVEPTDNVMADFTGQRNMIVGTELCLTDLSVGNVVAWLYQFGDGATSEDENPCHTYTTTGTKRITQTVTGASGTTNSFTRSLTVYEAPALSAIAAPNSGIAPLSVSFTAESTSITSYEWTFPDGSRAYTRDASYTFAGPGDYTVTVNGSGPVGSLTSSVTVTVRAPSDIRAAFGASTWNGIAPAEICFTDRSVGENITSWTWDFGDGAASAEQNPCHTFNTAGNYAVSLRVTDQDGLSASASSTVRLYDQGAGSASFRVTHVSGLNVCFESALGEGMQLVRWEFGDGSTSTEAAPCHLYPAEGTYTVTLIVSDINAAERALRSSIALQQDAAVIVEPSTPQPTPEISIFDPALSKIGFLPAGSIGLPGEELHWVTTVTNNGGAGGSVVVVDDVRPELQIEAVQVTSDSSYTINGQRVEVSIPSLQPGESREFTIITTVLTSPLDGLLDNTVTIDATGDRATATVSVPSGGFVAFAAPPLPDGPIPRINGAPELADFAGSEFCFTSNFTNSGANVGYGPYITLVRDANLALNSVGYLSFDLLNPPYRVASGILPAVDPLEGRAIPGTAGQEWITIRLPIGSLESTSPAVPIDICMQSLPLAEIGVPLPFVLFPGYEFGDTPTGANGPISNLNDQGPMDNSGSFTPILVTLAKSNTLPESEVPPSCYPAPPFGAAGQPGPECDAPPGVQWPYEYVLRIELAAGQTLTDNSFTDVLDPAFELYPYAYPVTNSSQAVIVGGSCIPSGADILFNGAPITALPPLEPSGGGTLTMNFSSITNPLTDSTCTLTMRYRGFITDILDEAALPTSYAAVNTASYDFIHVSGPQPTLTASNTVDVRNLELQKSASPGTVTPGTVVNYTLAFQISEYIGIQALSVTDIIPDGIDYNLGSAVVTVPGLGSAPITGANESIAYGDDTGTLSFNVTGALPGPYASAGTVTITYSGTVRQIYRPGGSLTGYVSANDRMSNTATANFTTIGGQTFSDESGASVVVIPNALTKQLMNTPIDPAAGFVAGEPVTFRLALSIPSGDTRNLIIDDNFPLPVFVVSDADFGIETGTFTLPDPSGRSTPFDVPNSSGYCSSYPNAVFPLYTRPCGLRIVYDATGSNGTNLLAGTSITVSHIGNSVRLTVNSPVETDVTEERRLVVELTAGIIDRPFADGLFLSNRSQASYTNTLGSVTQLNADDYLDIGAPDVQICKGITGTTNGASSASSGSLCSVPGAPNDDLTDVDASDVLTYTITARNLGSARAYGVVINDDVTTLPQLASCNLVSVLNGAGTPLAYTGTFPSISLTDALPGAGATGIAEAQATAVVTYTCVVADNVTPSTAVTNTASVEFASFSDTLPGGPHLNPETVPFPPRRDSANFTVTAAEITKTRTPATATIGDLITYTLEIDVPGGSMSNVSVVDTLDAGLAFVDCTAVTVTPGTLVSSLGAINSVNFCNDGTGAGSNPIVSSSGGVITWNFDDLTDIGTGSSDIDTITITYTAVVLNTSANVRGQNRNNDATLRWDNPSGGQHSDRTSAPNTVIIEPTLEVVKSAVSATNRDAGDEVTFTLLVRHVAGSNATAHDIALSDIIPTGLTYVAGSLAHTAGTAPLTLNESAGTISATYASLTTAQTSTLQFRVTLNPDVQPGQTITNTAGITWTSLPGSPINTTYNNLGVERTGNPADPGGAANTYRDTDPENVTVGNPSASKTVTATSLPETGNGSDSDPDLTIGEEVTYRMTITFREGLTRGVEVRDNLPTGTAVLSYVSSRILSIGTNLSFSSAVPTVGQAGTAADSNGDGILDRVSWALSDVTNSFDNVANAADQMTFEIVARVVDVTANSGLAPTQDLNVINTAQVRYLDFGGTVRTQNGTTTVDMVEPRLVINKTATPTTADAGDIVTYSVQVQNTGTAPAFNVVITDPLLPQLELITGTVVTSVGTVVTGNTVGDSTIRIETSPLAVNGTVTITYQARLRPIVFPGQQLINTAAHTFNSMPDNSGRPGSGSDTATVIVFVPAFSKDIVSTSEIATAPGTGTTNQYTAAPDLAIGETITYQMTIIVPEGTSNTLRLVDTLPSSGAGDPGTLTYVSSRVVSIGANIANSALAVGAPGTVSGQTVTFNFIGATPLTNTADGQFTAADEIVVEVTARAADLAANEAGDLLTNRARLTYDGNNTVDASASADVVEPNLNIDKSASPTSGLNAGDVVTYTLVVSHTGASTADAFDLRIGDLIPAGLTYVSGSLTNSAGTAATLDDSGAPTLVLTWDSLALGTSSTVTYQVTVDNTVTHNQSFTNTANLTYSSLEAGTPETNDPNERGYSDSDDAAVTANLTPLAFAKSVIASSETYTGSSQFDPSLTDLTIGETVTYELRARLREGTTPITLTDTLPDGLVYVSAALAPSNGANITITGGFPTPSVSGQVITLGLGNVVNSGDNLSDSADDLVVWITARASDVAANDGTTGVDKVNTAVLDWGGGTLTDTEAVEIVEPNLNIDKSASPTSGLDAGDVVTYTLVVSHTGASTADAFDLLVTDLIPAGMTYIPGSLNIVSGPGPSQSTATLTSLELAWVSNSFPLGASTTLTYQAEVSYTVTHGQVFTNTANLTYSSLPAGTPWVNDPNERDYTDTDDASVTADLAPSFVKSVALTGAPHTESDQFDASLTDLTIGEWVIFELRARLREGTTPVIMTDTLPDGLDFLNARVRPTPDAGMNLLIPTGFPTVTRVGQTVTVNVGNVVNYPDNVATEGDDLVVWISARVVDDAVLNNGTTGDDKINNATFTWGGGTLTDSESVEIVEPHLNIDKSASPTSGLDAGDVVTYTLVVSHEADSTADAFDLRIDDLLPAGLTYVSGSLTTVSGPTVTLGGTSTPTSLVLWLPILELGQASTVTYQVTLDNTVTHNQSFTNTANLSYSSLQGSGEPSERDYSDSDDAAVTANLTPLAFAKSVIASSETYTGSSQFDPSLTDLTIGETVTYELRARLREGTTPITLTDTLPDGLVYVSAALAPTNGANIIITSGFPTPSVSGQVITLGLGNVVNSGDNLSDSADDLVVWITARASDVVANDGTTGVDKVNTAVLDWGGGTLTDTEAVEIVEPNLNIDKSASPTSGLDAGDIVTYTISVSHLPDSTADAQDVVIDDLLPTDMSYAGGLTAIAGPAPTLSATSPTVRFTWADIPLGSTYTFSFDASLDVTVGPLQTLTNTADLTWTTLDGPDPNERDYTDSDAVDVGTTVPTLTKSLISTSLPETGTSQHDPSVTDVNIGETVTYAITVTMLEGTAQLVVTDDLPDVMTVVSARVLSLGANITTTGLGVNGPAALADVNFSDGLPDRAVFNLGTVVNTPDGLQNAADQIVLEVIARVDENAANVDAATLTNTATLDYQVGTDSDTTTVEVTEPLLQITKSALVVTGRPGDLIEYTLVVEHQASSTGPAYDLVITDPLLPDLNLEVGLVTTTRGTITSGNAAGDIALQIDVDVLDLGETITITYRAQIAPSVTPPLEFINRATVDYDSAPGQGGRDNSDEDTHTIRVNDDVYRYAKSVVATSVTQTGDSAFTSAPDATIGETVTFAIEAYLPEGLTTDFTITDNLPDGLIVVSSRVVSIGANLTTSSLAVGDAGAATNVNFVADGLDDQVLFSFGDVTNLVDGVDDDRDLITVEVVARVYDDSNGLNHDGRMVTNTALIDYGPNRRVAETPVDIVEPILTLTKSFAPRLQGRGQPVTMTLELVNTGGSTAYNVLLSDPLADGLCLNDVTVNVTAAPGTAYGDSSGSGCGAAVTVSFDQIAPGGRILITAGLVIDPALSPIPQSIPNTATVTYQSMPAGHPDEAQGRRYTTTGSDSLEVDQPTLTITKVGTPATVRAGGTLTYTITVTNTGDPEIDAYSVTVTDTLPNVLTLITASASQGACEVNGQNLTCTLGTLPRGASATITLEAQVALSAPAGMSIVNQAFVTSAEGAQAQAEAVNTVVSFTEAALCEVGCPDVQVYHSNRTGNWEIFRVGGPVSPDVQDTNRNLTQNPADDREPSLSQDGRWMAFSSNRDGNWEIYVMPTDGSVGQAQRVTFNTIAVDADPAWGPTDYLVYASTRDGNWELYLLDLRTGVETRLTNNDADDLNPFWSPDGSRIVFQSNRSGRWQLYELNLMTAAVRLLSDGSADDLDAAYSHDGSRIALRSLTTDGAVIMTMNANGSGRRVISEASASAANPVWSPDDRLIAYQSDLDGDLDIYIYEVASAQTRQLTDNAVDDYAPTWLCDARRVVFTSDTPGNPDIFRAEALPIDAAAIDVLDQAVRLTNHPAVDIYPEGAPNEENATLEGRLPDSQRAEVAHTALILPNVRATAPDTTLARGEAWRAVLGCAGTAFTQPPYQLGALPAR